MTAELLQFNNEENENQFGENQMEETFGIEETTEDVTPVAEATTSNEFLKGLLTGLAAGAVITTGVWFNERRKRLALLKQVELSTTIAVAIANGKTVVQFGKKEIDLAEEMKGNSFHLAEDIRERINTIRMSKKEKKRWLDALNNLIELSMIRSMSDLAEQVEKTVNQVMEEDIIEEVEELKEEE